MKIFGIDVSIHWSFWLVAAAIAFMMAPEMGILFGCWVAFVVMVTIVGHELAHALVARKYGHDTHSIILYVFGGIASIKGRLSNSAEFWVSLAGPAFNIVVAAAALIISVLSPSFMLHFWAPIIAVNLILGVFNLVPAYPMDGGRILRSSLTIRYGAKKATRIAHTVGKIIAGAFAVYGLFAGEIMLIIIGAFIVYVILEEQGKVNVKF